MTEAKNSNQPKERLSIPVGLITALWLPYALLAWRYWFLCDDAFISFRYSRNLARGHGLRFNPDGPAVEGFSNLWWVLLGAIPEAALLDPAWWLPLVTVACGGILVWRVVRVCEVHFGLDTNPSLLAGAFLAFAPAMGVWATSGLETMAFALLFFMAFEGVVLRSPGVMGACALVGLVGIRAEGPAWALVILALAWAVHAQPEGARPGDARRSVARHAALVALVVLGIVVFRLSVFGDWVPNTARAKIDFSVPLVVRGAKYVAVYALSFPAQALAVLCGMPLLMRRGGNGRAAVALAVAVPVWATVVGGDFFPMGRMLVAGLPFAAIAGAVSLQALSARLGARVALVAGVAAVVLGVLPAAGLHPTPESWRARLHFRLSDRMFMSEHARWMNLVGNTEKFVLRGRALAEHTRRGERIVARAVGAMGYHSDLFVYDQYGLTDPGVAGRPLGAGPLAHSPGHDREVDAIYFADREPDYLFARYVRGPGAAVAMADSLRRWSVPAALRDHYVPDFVETNLKGQEERGFLFLVRRASEGEDGEEQWASFEARRKALHLTLAVSR